jgi:hypothetical protein
MIVISPSRTTTLSSAPCGSESPSPACRRALWIPLLLAGTYLLLLLAQLPRVIAATYLNADAASAPVIGTLAGHGSGGIVLGNMPWYSTLLFELATRGLPLHRQLWELAPYGMALASVGLIAWALARVAERWSALLAAAILLCAGPQLLLWLSSLDDHSTTWFTLALLGAWAVALQHSPLPSQRRSWLLAVIAGLTIAVIAGLNAASDELALAGGLIPLALSGILAWRRCPNARSRTGAAAALGTAALAAALAIVVTHLMHSHGVTYDATLTFGSTAQVQANLTLWWQSLAALANGDFFAAPVGATGMLAAACAVLALLAAATALYVSRLELGGSPWPGAGGRGEQSPTVRARAARTAHVTFWVSAGVLTSLAYVLSSAPDGLLSSRFLVGVLYTIVALVVLLPQHRPRLRGALVAGAVVYCLAGVLAMARGTATANPAAFPNGTLANKVAEIAAGQHLTRGYAGYWDAAPIDWAAHLRVHIYPVMTCPAGLCRFFLHTIAAWYDAQPEQRTFLLVDPAQPLLAAPPPELGTASASYPIGRLTMYVYPYDIASRISPASKA